MAHIEQQPEELPHHGFLHIAEKHGLGRNWIGNVLCRVFGSYARGNFDLAATLNSGFNGDLSGRSLVIVDEINEGMSSNRHKQAQSLKQLVTEERRTINPKYGRQHVEWNSCRWLVFSNSITALPLEDGDRRWYVVANKEKPKPSEYYARLYGLIKDLSFIASVAHALAVRDISAFRAGERPPLNAAKQAVLDRSKSEFELDLQDIREHWPSDLIASHELQEVIGEDDWPTRGVVRYRLDDASIIKLHGYQDYNAWKKREKRMIYCLRNLDHWQSAGRTKCDAEIRSRPLSEKTADYDANRRKH